jgi:hypothetical protein
MPVVERITQSTHTSLPVPMKCSQCVFACGALMGGLHAVLTFLMIATSSVLWDVTRGSRRIRSRSLKA